MRFIGFYNYTVILTYLSLVSSMIGIKLAFDGEFFASMACLATSGILDMFDGAVARTKKDRTQDQKNFGIQLDSLCDVVCFGVFPAIFLYFNGVDSIFGIALLILFVLCAVIRLAFFNVLETKRQATEGGVTKKYRGLPVTSTAIIVPIIFLLQYVLDDNVMVIIYHVLAVAIPFLFILDIGIPKIKIDALFQKKSKKTKKKVRKIG